jgi:hypothetical protein
MDEDNKKSPEKIKKEKVEGVEDVEIRRELYKKDQELKAKEEELATLKSKLQNVEGGKPEVPQAPNVALIEQLQAQVENLSRQVIGLAPNASKLKFREPTAADLVKEGEEVTFTARSILYVVASYRDYRGIEKMPPHKLIIFTYAASDRRKDGREEQIINFSQYTTNLKTEIDFLRGHPFYGITFGENTTEMANEDVSEMQYRARAATMLSTMTPEVVFQRAQDYGIPNWRQKSPEQLRHLIVMAMADEFKSEKKRQQEDIIKRNLMRQLSVKDKNEE